MTDQIIGVLIAITGLLCAVQAILKEIRKWRRGNDAKQQRADASD